MSGRLIQMSGIVVDLVHAVDAWPVPGGEVEATRADIAAGGGFNALVAARRSGAEVAYGGALGSGVFADIAQAALEAEGIAVLQRWRKPMDQGHCVVLVEAGGERSFISHHGAERHLDLTDIEAIRPAPADWILVTGYALHHPRSRFAMTAWLKGLPRGPTLFFDPGPMVAEIPAAALATVLDRADWVSANRIEAEVLTGRSDPSDAALSLAAGRGGALARDGARGCWLAGPRSEVEPVAGFDVDAVDTTGAGDAHDGAFIAASLRGHSPRDAATFANAAAAIITATRGPATAPRLEAVRAFLAARGAEVRPPFARSEASFRHRV